MSRSSTTTSAHNTSSTPPVPDMEVPIFQDEDFTASLTDLINDSFTLLEHLEEASEVEERTETASIETTLYSIEYHANTSAHAESAYSSSSAPSTHSAISASSSPFPSGPTQSIRLVSNEHSNAMEIDILIDLVQSDTLLTVTGKLKIMEAIMRENDLAKAYIELSQMRKTIRILWYEERFPGEWLAFGTAASENAMKVMPMPAAREGEP